jgi:hypothetical protein
MLRAVHSNAFPLAVDGVRHAMHDDGMSAQQ